MPKFDPSQPLTDLADRLEPEQRSVRTGRGPWPASEATPSITTTTRVTAHRSDTEVVMTGIQNIITSMLIGYGWVSGKVDSTVAIVALLAVSGIAISGIGGGKTSKVVDKGVVTMLIFASTIFASERAAPVLAHVWATFARLA